MTTCKQRKTFDRYLIAMTALLFGLAAGPALADEHGGVVGEKISDFASKVTSVTYLEGRNVVNLQTESDVATYGTVGSTAEFIAPSRAKGTTGVYKTRGMAFRPDGATIGFTGHGAWKALGDNRWSVTSIIVDDEGARNIAVATLELKTMMMKGSLYKLP